MIYRIIKIGHINIIIVIMIYRHYQHYSYFVDSRIAMMMYQQNDYQHICII